MKKVALIFLTLFSLTVNAYQRIPVQEASPISANVSADALNRIAVENDRIIGVKGTSGQFELDKDVEAGQIFVKPVVKEGDEPIHIFITTEKGRTYSLGLIVSEIGAESIVLAPLEDSIATTGEKSSSYESALKELVKAMHTQTTLEGFSIERAQLKLPKIQGAQVSHVQSYAGRQLLGEVLEVTNNNHEAIFLTEADFYREGIRAVSIIDKAMPAKSKTRVYLVRS